MRLPARWSRFGDTSEHRYTGWPKKLAHFFVCLNFIRFNLSNTDQFSRLFHCLHQENIRNNNVAKDITKPQVCRYTHYLVKCQRLTSNKWKQEDFCNNTCEEISNNKNNVFIYCLGYYLNSKVTVASCSFYIKCSMHPRPFVWPWSLVLLPRPNCTHSTSLLLVSWWSCLRHLVLLS